MKFLKVTLHFLVVASGIGAILIGSQTYELVTPSNPNLNKLTQREIEAPHGTQLVTSGAFLILAGVLLAGLELIPEDGLEFSEPETPVLAFRYQPTKPTPTFDSTSTDSPEGIEEEEEGTDVWGGYDAEELAEALDSIESSYNNTKQTA